ncbi:MAG: amidase domain-containing protein [Lachnoclostridium sp.]|nr:amidase domain-containing protein [Lachnoclostridium sp.]
MPYNRTAAIAYAHEWAFKRNPDFYDFSDIGGDCTNFASQCLLAGGEKMNFHNPMGWYYTSINDRSAAWSGVPFLYDFLISNTGEGPKADEVGIEQIAPGDIIQLSFKENIFNHSLFVVDTGEFPNISNVLIATHTLDSDYRPLATYQILAYRCLKIKEENPPQNEMNPEMNSNVNSNDNPNSSPNSNSDRSSNGNLSVSMGGESALI